MHSVGSVDVAELSTPAPQPGGDIRYPQGVTCAARSRRAKTRIDSVQLVGARPFAQQPGQLGDVRFFHPAPRMPAGPVGAGGSGPALAHLSALIDRDLPGLLRDQPDRGALTAAEFPADGVGQLVPGPGLQLMPRRIIPASGSSVLSQYPSKG